MTMPSYQVPPTAMPQQNFLKSPFERIIDELGLNRNAPVEQQQPETNVNMPAPQQAMQTPDANSLMASINSFLGRENQGGGNDSAFKQIASLFAGG